MGSLSFSINQAKNDFERDNKFIQSILCLCYRRCRWCAFVSEKQGHKKFIGSGVPEKEMPEIIETEAYLQCQVSIYFSV